MDTDLIKAYYTVRGLQWADPKSALLFFLSEVGELAEAYAAAENAGLNAGEHALLCSFADLGLKADEMVSRKSGWVRNNDRLREPNVAHEVADCNMMLSVFLESFSGRSPDDALIEKMALKLGIAKDDLCEYLNPLS